MGHKSNNRVPYVISDVFKTKISINLFISTILGYYSLFPQQPNTPNTCVGCVWVVFEEEAICQILSNACATIKKVPVQISFFFK